MSITELGEKSKQFASSQSNPVITSARRLVAAGRSGVPIDHTTKRPLVPWKEYQEGRPTSDDLDAWEHMGVQAFALVGGAVSGNVETLDFDVPGYYERWCEATLGLHENLVKQRTGGGGWQVTYCCGTVEKNQKLAWHPDESAEDGRVIAIETRAEGGYFVVAPSLHPSGNHYELVSGDYANIPTVTPAVREVLLQAARDLCQAPYSRKERERMEQANQASHEKEARQRDDSEQPHVIDTYNERHKIGDVLERNGYKRVGSRYIRPGADHRSVGCVHIEGNRSFHHSSNDPLCDGYWHRPFDVYLHYQHHGNLKEAVKAAAAELGLTYVNGNSADAATAPAKKPDAPTVPFSEQMIEALEALGYAFRLNVLEDTVELDGERFDDVMRSEIILRMKDRGFAQTYVDHAVNVLAGRNRYHPVQDYLNGLKWDGQNHFGEFAAHLHGDGSFVEYSAERRESFVKVAFYRFMLGCVATALDGANMDTFQHQTPMLVPIGGQGIGKSTQIRWLCSGLGARYYRESPLNPHSTDDIRSMVTKWIWEVAELGASLRRTDRESLKSFITTQQFTYRKPYARYDITKPKLCNLVGTLNPDGTGFLDDPTGHRRFLPVVLKGIDHGYKDRVDVNQLWAQLVHLYRQGERPALTQRERQALGQEHQKHEVENPLETYVNMYFDIEPGNDDQRMFTAQIIDRLRAFGVSLPNDTRVAGKAVAEVLTTMGLDNNGGKAMRIDGITGKGWKGIAPNDREAPTR